MFIYHLVTQSDWETAALSGSYQPTSLTTDGFIHASTDSQLLPVANLFYKGARQLFVLKLDPAKMKTPVKFEDPVPPAPGFPPNEKFPHIYGAILVSEVLEVFALVQNSDGEFLWPGAIR